MAEIKSSTKQDSMILVFDYAGPPGLRSQALQAARMLAGEPDRGEDPWNLVGIIMYVDEPKWQTVKRMEELGYLFIKANKVEPD